MAISAFLIWTFEDSFDKDVWRTSPLTRYKMSNDIIENGLLIGKSRDDITELLGNPDMYTTETQNVLIYKIGKPPSFFEAKEEKLAVVFKNDSVIRVGIASE